ncbi:MAG: hypothetical protein NC342_03645 [Pseudoflavonifractor sp.]|nr:hypothetical protein [Alloprevotella sp.]MCM1116609.1 hypothetical protein [Pseudoflavonifractor sp.]
MSLDSEVQRNYDVPLQADNLPDSVTLIQEFPPYISATVQGKGAQLVRFMWGRPSPMKISFDAANAVDGVFSVSQQKLEARLRDYFGQGVQILSAKPDSLTVTFTTGPGRRVPLKILTDITADLLSIQSGEPTANVDSVTLYAVGDIPSSVRSVSTELIAKTGVKDTSRYDVKVAAPEGMRAIPDHVIVTVPVEPLIAKKCNVEIESGDLPHDTRLVTFPASVEVSYLVPMSKYGEDYPIRAFVSYQDALRSQSGKIAVELGPIAGRYYSISMSPDSVEYIIEHDHN